MAAALGGQAMKKLMGGETENAFRLQPFYLRASEAEIKMQEKQKAQEQQKTL